MGRGLHFSRTQIRPYTGEYHRIAAKIFRSALTAPLGEYTLSGIDKSKAHCKFTLKDSERWGRVMVFTFDDREIPIPLKQDDRSASNKLYLICPYCTKPRQHLYALSNTYVCRLCAGLHYASQSERESDRLARRIRKLRRKLWGNDTDNGWLDINNLMDSCCWWPKPKRMRLATFEKKKAEIEALEKRHTHCMRVFIEMHFGKNSEYENLFCYE